MDNETPFPLVSIVCTTYNHQNYIESAIKGFLIQQTTFPIEIIIHDDASTDNTVKILKEYEAKYPNLFHNIYQSENQYSKNIDIWSNLFNTKCRGKYIAICEGDDYWIDPLKLQKQVSILESDSKCGMVYGKVRYFQQLSRSYTRIFGCAVNDLNSLLKGNVIPTLTVCFRRELYSAYLHEINPNEKKWKMADYPIWLWFIAKTRISFVDNVLGVYRVLSESVSHSNTDLNKQLEFIKSYSDVKLFYVEKFDVNDQKVLNNIEEQYLIGLLITIVNHNANLDILKTKLKESRVFTLKLAIIRLLIKMRITYKLLKIFLMMVQMRK